MCVCACVRACVRACVALYLPEKALSVAVIGPKTSSRPDEEGGREGGREGGMTLLSFLKCSSASKF